MKKFIAERKLIYALKGSDIKNEFLIGICNPFKKKFNTEDVINAADFYGCLVEFSGLDEQGEIVYGADSLQAINIASDVEVLLMRLSKKYDFFWSSGEPYFDE